MQERCEENGFSEGLIFSEESTFHISAKMNKENVRIWGTENSRATLQRMWDSPMCSVLCPVKKCTTPFFSKNKTVTGASYLDMLINWLMPQLHEDNLI
jgi:hypothetical protein